jgi:hypothetical protein
MKKACVNDDAVHIEDLTRPGLTFCNQNTWDVLNVADFNDVQSDSGSGCWTCLVQSQRRNTDDR